MTRRIIAIAFIWGCSAVAWIILGVTINNRTESSETRLGESVSSNWGSAQKQEAPAAFYEREIVRSARSETPAMELKEGKAGSVKQPAQATLPELKTTERVLVPLIQSRVHADLDLEHRQKGLMWYPTYKVAFKGAYKFQNTSTRDSLTLQFRFPAEQAIYDDVQVSVNGVPVVLDNTANGITTSAVVAPGAVVSFGVQYRSQGLNSWRYVFGETVTQVQDFVLSAKTNFKEIDFAENTLSASAKQETGDGWNLTWQYKNLLSGYPIGIVMPEHLQPGQLAGDISLFAPVSLFFFFFLMFIITTVRKIELHPMNYFFLAAAFFSFHLLLAYLVDHVSIHVAFVVASAVSVALVISYLRLVVDTTFAAREAALAQVLFLVLFSYAFFFKGFTGLAITIGSIVTLFVVMQMTGRVRWTEKFARAVDNSGNSRLPKVTPPAG